MAKILVGVPTYAGHAFCRLKLLEFLHEINKEPWIDVLILWNGVGDPWGFEEFEVKTTEDFEVTLNRRLGEEQSLLQSALVKKQAYLRERVLQRDYTHLFLLESDVIPPHHAVKKLLMWDKDIVTGIYFVKAQEQVATKVEGNEFMKMRLHQSGLDKADTVFYVKEATVPCVWDFQKTSIGGFDAPRLGHRIMMIEDWVDYFNLKERRLYPVAASGTGCLLIKREVLEKVRFLGGPEHFANKEIGAQALSDYIFSENARKEGFEIFMDVDLICQHYNVVSFEDRKISKEFTRKFQHEGGKVPKMEDIGTKQKHQMTLDEVLATVKDSIDDRIRGRQQLAERCVDALAAYIKGLEQKVKGMKDGAKVNNAG